MRSGIYILYKCLNSLLSMISIINPYEITIYEIENHQSKTNNLKKQSEVYHNAIKPNMALDIHNAFKEQSLRCFFYFRIDVKIKHIISGNSPLSFADDSLFQASIYYHIFR